MTAILSAQKLEKSFGSFVAAHDISCEIARGETVGIIGANGAGKTTFVNMISGHLVPTAGPHHVRRTRHHRLCPAPDHAAWHRPLVSDRAGLCDPDRAREHVHRHRDCPLRPERAVADAAQSIFARRHPAGRGAKPRPVRHRRISRHAGKHSVAGRAQDSRCRDGRGARPAADPARRADQRRLARGTA